MKIGELKELLKKCNDDGDIYVVYNDYDNFELDYGDAFKAKNAKVDKEFNFIEIKF